MGLRYDDFCRCTPSEFSAIVEMWNKREDVLHRTSWEQTRHLMVAMIQPYSKKPIKPTDIMKFEWDKKKTPPKPVEKSTRERMEAVRARLKKSHNGQ